MTNNFVEKFIYLFSQFSCVKIRILEKQAINYNKPSNIINSLFYLLFLIFTNKMTGRFIELFGEAFSKIRR